ncbi:MAG: exo-alpha-sialidase, partial [Myxococcales bacterium]|nr:exo-alpha-sialidase [Myxococcales bacterium]
MEHQKAGRSGHLGHAMFQNHDHELFAFYADCTGEDFNGHSAVGWMQYKVSPDGGLTWGEPQILDLSKRYSDQGAGRTLFSEKAVVTDSGAVVMLHLVCDVSRTPVWEPYHVPLATRSLDGGYTWGEPIEVGNERGRIYGAAYTDGTIYVLKFCNDATVDYCGASDEHVYRLFVSYDDGVSFEALSTLPFDTRGRGYGTICVRSDGSLVAYVYNRNDETAADYCISKDGGRTWEAPRVAFMARRLRNPQMISFAGAYFMHGRSGSHGADADKGHVILYRSPDGITWDEGTYLARREHGHGAY